ncbi:IS4 family transposase [Chroococcidiopsis sp. CCMEE 29]|uniref:IS4 family transposase n=1 Tax=Chroococcidiopsis sp. CCMEE 29 TaxID=155894 RepID=UPI0020215438|nr:IS4 family transposase [Chroococcidiopsis sp. CCMEE 29]
MTITNIPNRVEILKQKFTNSLGLPFRDLLLESTIREALNAENLSYRRRLFDPFVTLWVFLSQVLDTDKTCHNAVSRVITWLASVDAEIPSVDTSAYCQARKRLPENLLSRLFANVARDLGYQVTSEHLWCGRHVKVVDGSTVSMPDTLENQAAYPQPSSQAFGCGFPIAKIGALFSIATGAAVAVVVDVLNIHDIKLARLLYQFLNPGDVLLGDCAFCSYADLIFIQNYNCDAIFRLSQARKNQVERCRRKPISSFESIEVWRKPSTRPKGLTPEEFTSIPKTLTVRVIKYYIPSPGYRTKYVILVTTLLDPEIYPTTEIMRLYGQRWEVELDLKHLKTTLGMDVLRGKTPQMVRKEIYAYLLAYNLLRTVMWEAGTTHKVDPLRLSLQGARQHLDNFIPQLAWASNKKRVQLYQTLLKTIVHKSDFSR